MHRTSVNPSQWGLAYQMDQAEVIEGAARVLHCSGQVALEADPDSELGVSVIGAGDLRAQITHVLGLIDELLESAGMSRSTLTSLRFFTTDIDGFLENYDVYAGWIEPAGIRPPQSLLGINRLVHPDLLVEIEATAAA
ncbi:MAG: RidA family protein [Acidimicrobiia bacterium]|nr:RidA family protein [Acidimicrobiia bacterium]